MNNAPLESISPRSRLYAAPVFAVAPFFALGSLFAVVAGTLLGGCGGDATMPMLDAGDDLAAAAPDLTLVIAGVDPPFGRSSGGTGGAAPVAGAVRQAGGISYRLIVPDSPAVPSPLLLVYSGTEGGQLMTQNLTVAGPATSTDGYIRVILDGVVYRGNGAAGATALDDVRAHYDIDNDQTYLLGESAGTTAALALGFHLRPSWFAAYWANDVNAVDAPDKSAADLGFAPFGQAGPGGDFIDATAIVDAMRTAGYQLPDPAPYAGPGANLHGDKNQFVAALRFFNDKSRK